MDSSIEMPMFSWDERCNRIKQNYNTVDYLHPGGGCSFSPGLSFNGGFTRTGKLAKINKKIIILPSFWSSG